MNLRTVPSGSKSERNAVVESRLLLDFQANFQEPPWTTEDLRLLEYLAPHLQTAAKLQARLRAAKHIENLEVNAQHLIEQYDFTPAEVRLAGALFQGESVEIYAERTKTPINTVRWQIRRIYTKLDVHSQTELFPALARTISKFHDLG